MSQFEFLVMTEKNIFAHKLFLSLNTSDFNLFLCENCNTPEKSHPPPLFPRKPPLKVKVLSSPPLLENLVGGSTPLQKGGRCPLWFSVSIMGMFVYKEVTSNDTIISSFFNGNISHAVGK